MELIERTDPKDMLIEQLSNMTTGQKDDSKTLWKEWILHLEHIEQDIASIVSLKANVASQSRLR